MPKPVSRSWQWPVLIALLAVAASIGGIGNLFAQDDIAIIWKNAAMHDLGGMGRFFTTSYWPPPFIPALYRPLASVSFALQWALGGGEPLIFRLVSYTLYAVTCVAVFRLARVGLPVAVAVLIAALFAVHPLHVEAVALGVNQNEIWVGLIACGMVMLYLRERAKGGPLSPRAILLLALLYLAACLLKENALVLPALLVAAELLLVRPGERLWPRIPEIRPALLLLGALGLAFYWVRIKVLSGNLAGTYTAEALFGLDTRGRAITMLGVVPHWFRLFFWPEHLRADYAPSELVAQTVWGPMQTLGAGLLLGSLLLMWWSWRRAPMLAFGVAWCAVGLLPVHNVLLPTGIVLAERTLFLPSIGVMLGLGGLAAWLSPRIRRPVRVAAAALGVALVAVGIYRSNLRHQVWTDQFKLWYVTANEDAPRSFRAHEAMAESYWNIGMYGHAEQEYQLSMRLAPPLLTGPMLSYAHRLRTRGNCYPAVELYKRALKVRPSNMAGLAPLIACRLFLGQYRVAAAEARLAMTYGWREEVFRQAIDLAESALEVGATPGTVRISLPPRDELFEYMTVGLSR